jgi:5'-methylthioadenosine phosphorylase
VKGKIIGLIGGSGLYELSNIKNKEETLVQTKFGPACLALGTLSNCEIAFLARHGSSHDLLPNMINYRANLLAFKQLKVEAIISTTVVGVIQPDVPLAKPIIFDDFFFPDNRLPTGETCTIFTEAGALERGHFIFDTPFSPEIKNKLIEVTDSLNISLIKEGIYACLTGPRFNSKVEIKWLQKLGITAISQTCGPEIVLAGELEIPYQLIGFGIDYANGVAATPTPVDELNKNLAESTRIFQMILEKALETNFSNIRSTGFVYRFESEKK